MEKKSVKAVIQPIDIERNPIGEPVEVYHEAKIEATKGIPEVRYRGDRDGFGAFLLEVVSLYTGEIIPLHGVYTRSDDAIDIMVNGDILRVVYCNYSRAVTRKRKSGEKEYRPMWSEEVVKLEEKY